MRNNRLRILAKSPFQSLYLYKRMINENVKLIDPINQSQYFPLELSVRMYIFFFYFFYYWTSFFGSLFLYIYMNIHSYLTFAKWSNKIWNQRLSRELSVIESITIFSCSVVVVVVATVAFNSKLVIEHLSWIQVLLFA